MFKPFKTLAMSKIGFAPNFTFEELTKTNQDVDNIPRDGNHIARLRHLSHKLQYLRDCTGLPLYILWAYLCPRLNARLGRHPTSRHMTGSAADISILNLSESARDRLDRAILDSKPCEFIKYDTFWHVAYDFIYIGWKDRSSDTWQESEPDFKTPLTKGYRPTELQGDSTVRIDF